MNKLLSHLIVLIVGAAVGYVVYPNVNTAQDSQLVSTPETHSLVQQEPKTSSSPKVDVKPSMTDLVNTRSPQTPTTSTSTNTNKSAELVTRESVVGANESEQDLAEWQVKRRSELSELVSKYMPDTVAPFFESKLLENNTHLNTPNNTEISVADQEWALEMEQLIRDRVMLHEKGVNLDMHSVKCIHKVCEVLGKSIVPGSWHAVHWDIVKHVLEKDIELLTEQGTNLSFEVEGNEHFYFQFVFG